MQLWADLTGPRLPWCRLRVLLENMPADSSYVRAVDPDRRTSWGIAEQLLAEVVYQQRFQVWFDSDPKRRGPEPQRIPMPWDDQPAPTRSTLTPAEMERRLIAQRDEHRARRRGAAPT